MAYIYLASPYSHVDKAVRLKRFEAVERATAWLLNRRIWTFSPIVHCHNLAQVYGLPTDAEFWHAFNAAMLERSQALWILGIEGWQDSRGIMLEADLANQLKLPIKFMSPENNTSFTIGASPA
jgi:Domain of unknown function (DUF1937)